LTLTPSGHYYEITNDGGGYDLTVSLSGDAMAVGSVLYIAYISTGGGRTCTITSTGVNVLLSGGKEAASFIKTSVGWLPMPKGASTS
jgi:predicted RecA/RadA family phage recombinase